MFTARGGDQRSVERLLAFSGALGAARTPQQIADTTVTSGAGLPVVEVGGWSHSTGPASVPLAERQLCVMFHWIFVYGASGSFARNVIL